MYCCSKADIRNPHSLLAHEHRQLRCLSAEHELSENICHEVIPHTHHLMLHAFELGDCLFCVHIAFVMYPYIPVFHTLAYYIYIFSIISRTTASSIGIANTPAENSTTSPIPFCNTKRSFPSRTFLSV